MTAKTFRRVPTHSIVKARGTRSQVSKKVFFDEVHVQEYPMILGDNPSVSCGAPITIDWKPFEVQTMDVDFYEYCRLPERRNRKKLILSVHRRAQCLMQGGYSIEDIANATLAAEETKQMRADSLKSAGWMDPWSVLSGAAEATGTALKRADILGVGTAVGAGVQGVNTMVGAGADATVRTGKLIVGGALKSTKAVTDAGNNLLVKPVGKVVSTTGRVVTSGVTQTGRVIGSGISNTGKAVGSVVTSTGRALSMIVPGAQPLTPERRSLSPKRNTASNPIPDLTAMKIR